MPSTYLRKNGLYVPEEEDFERVKGRSQIGYSRRGFLGMLASALAAPAMPRPPELFAYPIKWGVDLASAESLTVVTLAFHPIVSIGEHILIDGARYVVQSVSFDGYTAEAELKGLVRT